MKGKRISEQFLHRCRTAWPAVTRKEDVMSLPGFSAEQSLTFTRMRYRIVGQPEYSPDMEHVSPQFTGRALVCTALGIAIVGGQEELIPVFFELCSISA